jgi:O-antigen ligase
MAVGAEKFQRREEVALRIANCAVPGQSAIRNLQSAMVVVASSTPMLRRYLTERRVVGVALCLILAARLVPCVSDVNHPPGMRTVRVVAALLVLALGAIEFYRPWRGFFVFVILWPHMLALREIVSKAWPLFHGAPMLWGGAACAALGTAVWLRSEREQSAAAEADSTPTALRAVRVCMWLIVAFTLLSTLIATLRLWNAAPPGWLTQRADVRHLLDPGMFVHLMPLIVALEYLPQLLLALLLLNLFCDPALKASREKFPATELALAAGLSGLVLALEVLTQRVGGWSWSFDLAPPSGSFANRNTTAPLMVVFATLLCAVAFAYEGARKTVLLASGGFCVAVALLTGSRNGVFTAAVVLWLLLFLRGKPVRMAVAGALVALLAAVVLWLPLPDRAPSGPEDDRLVKTIEQIRAGNWEEVTAWRAGIYRAAWEVYADHPLAGAGPGTFPMLGSEGGAYRKYISRLDLYFYVTHAHSFPMQLLAEIGLAGALAWLALFIAIPFHGLLRWRAPWWALPLLAAGVSNLFDAGWLSPGVGAFCAILLCIALKSGDLFAGTAQPAR